MLIHKDALVVHEVTTAEHTRYFLDGALIDKQGRTVATDGHMLVRYTSNPCDPAAFAAVDGADPFTAAEDVIVSRDDLRAALATVGKSKHANVDCQYLAVVPNGTHVTIATAKANRTVQITARKVEGSFPAYERVLTVTDPVVSTIILNAEYLETLGRMARQVGARAIKFTLHGDGSGVVMKQVFFTAKADNGTLDGALMPMRE